MSLTSISPIDGRYARKTAELSNYFSEFGLIHYRLKVELLYFLELTDLLPELKSFPAEKKEVLWQWIPSFNISQAEEIKALEKTTNHDIKALEYWIKRQFETEGLQDYLEFVHFGLTSQDINNTAIPLMVKDAWDLILIPKIKALIEFLDEMSEKWASIPMLSRTHGQPASPTWLGKEIFIFSTRLSNQLELLEKIPHRGKFGGATGNFNAHHLAYPEIDWHQFATHFLRNKLGIERSYPTTQIDHYDFLAAQLDGFKRINTILIDVSRDFWTYISMDYFKQSINPNETGSSAMPHKVNPIDFENAEGNLGIANALFAHLSEKLPVSRLQRDLTDSTVLRNLGVPFGHTLIALNALITGLNKLSVNLHQIQVDLDNNWAVVAEGIQTLLRKEGFPEPYEALKKLTRQHGKINRQTIAEWTDTLNISQELKTKINSLTPQNYTGPKKWKI
jgi:adenylosuccinate lyase